LAVRGQQRSDELQQQFITDVSVYDPNMLSLYVAESGSDKRSALRRYGYALKEKPAVADKEGKCYTQQ